MHTTMKTARAVTAAAVLAAGLTGLSATANATTDAARPKVTGGKSRTGNTLALVARQSGKDWNVVATTNPRANHLTLWWNCGRTVATTKSKAVNSHRGSVTIKSSRACIVWASAWWVKGNVPRWDPRYVTVNPRLVLP